MAALGRYWEDPALTSQGRLPMHSVVRDEHLLLDGEWDFCLLGSPDAEPTGPWRSITVPGCWTMQGTTDFPIYTNVAMPFPGEPPAVPDANPTGVYRRSFDLPAHWAEQRVVLRVGAAESVLVARLNGTHIGLSKDSHLAAEFDVTSTLVAGGNLLELIVVKWSDASYVEDQDQWWHGGITRSVLLYPTPPVHLADVRLDTDLTSVTATVLLGGTTGPPDGWTVELDVAGHVLRHEPDRTQLPAVPTETMIRAREEFFAHPPGPRTTYAPDLHDTIRAHLTERGAALQLRHEEPDAEAWSHESPRLYDATVTLRDASGAAVDVSRHRIGFRTVRVVGRELLVNGQPVLLRGVNRHDFDERTGRVIAAEDMRADLVLMKEHGFNAVRTAHYPNDPVFLDLCDELGVYVVAEANIEAHAFRAQLADDPRYLGVWVDRVSRMAQRDKNHPSVLVWSLGNEAGCGSNHAAAAAWLRAYDTTRPLQYEGAIAHDWDANAALTDIICPMYAGISALVSHATGGQRQAPIVLCEYSHAMGNSNGGLAEYWDAIEATPGLQGGFVWEWRDHGLVQSQPDGTARWAYGGDFGETVHDSTFCLDGVVFPDRTPKPALKEHQHLATPVTITGRDGRLEVHSRRWFTDLDDLTATWELTDESGVLADGLLTLRTIRPRTSVSVPLELPEGNGERWLTVRFTSASAALGWQQIAYGKAGPRPAPGATRPADVDEDGLLRGLPSAPRLSLWRAPTDNDRWGLVASLWERWGLADLTRTCTGVVRTATSTDVSAIYVTSAGIAIPTTTTYRVDDKGRVHVDESADLPTVLTDLPRVGTVLELPARDDDVLTWFGRGPHESYPDRCRGAAVGRWSLPVDELHVPYIRPQESGGRAEVRWFETKAYRIELDRPRQVSVSRYRAADLAAATHHPELVPRPDLVVHLDAAHRGLGTASCGPDTLPPHLVGPGTRTWSWTLMETAR